MAKREFVNVINAENNVKLLLFNSMFDKEEQDIFIFLFIFSVFYSNIRRLVLVSNKKHTDAFFPDSSFSTSSAFLLVFLFLFAFFLRKLWRMKKNGNQHVRGY